MKRVLFVDDEPNVLDGLRRMLYPLRREWEMAFVQSGRDALSHLASSEFDVLVTDIRMPEMTGIELLSEVLHLYPQVIRMVLSGTVDQEMSLRTVALAHQYLLKPCDASTLRRTVERALDLRALLADAELKRLISRLPTLPSLPSVYTELVQALQSPDVSPQTLGQIVGADLAMATKLLQIVNSPLFGIRRQINDPSDAVVYLGTDTIRSLTLTISVFAEFDSRRCPSFSIEGVRDHGMAVAALSRKIAASLKLSCAETDDAYLGGLLHDIGKLILAHHCSEQYEEALQYARREGLPYRIAELNVFGTTHAEAGAYLLWLWGLPDPVTEIVARHHTPGQGSALPVVVVHAADALLDGKEEGLDMACLEQAGVIGELDRWREMREEVLEEVH
jgi:putative nucleotidyltransferase with HDIG domain